jgi:hypothetical protein
MLKEMRHGERNMQGIGNPRTSRRLRTKQCGRCLPDSSRPEQELGPSEESWIIRYNSEDRLR